MSKRTPEKNQRLELATSRVVRQWASLETGLALILASLLNTDQFRARVVWGSMPNWRARRELLARLAETYLAPVQLRRFKSLLRRAKSLGENRNLLVHSSGGVVDDGGVWMLRDAPDEELGFNFLSEQYFDLVNVEGWAPAIQTLTTEFMNFAGPIYTSPRMHREPRPDPP